MASAQIAAAKALAAATPTTHREPQPPSSATPASPAAAPIIPDDPGLNPAAPAELLHLELPQGALTAARWRPRFTDGPAVVAAAPGHYSRELFAQRFGELSFKTLLTQPVVIGALVKVHVECAKVRKMCLFSCQTAKTLRLEEFEQVQGAATDATANHLRDNWLASIKHIIK